MIIDLNANITQDFKWKEALALRDWDIYVYPTPEIAANIVATAQKMQMIRDLFGQPIYVTSWYRPHKYNKHIGSRAKKSMHIQGLACDFVVRYIDCDTVRQRLIGRLADFGIRMERWDGANWVHIDLKSVPDSQKYFQV